MNAVSCDEVRELAAAYVLDGLSSSVWAAVRDHLAGHAGVHAEFAEFGGGRAGTCLPDRPGKSTHGPQGACASRCSRDRAGGVRPARHDP